MRVVANFLGLAVCLAVFTSSAGAAVILTFETGRTFTADSGIQAINVFANSNAGGESAVSIGADFTLGGAAVFNTPNAGTFGGAGFLGNGNIALGGSSFDRDTNAGFENTGYLNINFNAAQQVGAAPTPLATLLVNTAGLAAGNYSINATNGFFGLGTIADATGSFTIQVSGVPEPTSIALLGVAIGGVFGRRMLRKKKVAQV